MNSIEFYKHISLVIQKPSLIFFISCFMVSCEAFQRSAKCSKWPPKACTCTATLALPLAKSSQHQHRRTTRPTFHRPRRPSPYHAPAAADGRGRLPCPGGHYAPSVQLGGCRSQCPRCTDARRPRAPRSAESEPLPSSSKRLRLTSRARCLGKEG